MMTRERYAASGFGCGIVAPLARHFADRVASQRAIVEA
jgi:hypothetical protein